MTINLRLAHSADYPLVLNLCEEMIRPLAVVWTDWIAADQEGHFADLWRQEHNRVITFIDQQNIGWVEFRRTGDETVLKQLCISPALQRHGVGSEVMRLLLKEQRGIVNSMALFVLKNNPAFQFYWRLGFNVVQETSTKFVMRL